MGARVVRGRWLVGVGLVVVGLVGLWVVYFLPAGPRGEAISYAQFVVALVGAVIAVLGWLRSIRPDNPRSVDALADRLALAVGGEWRQEAVERMLVTPAPIPVDWSLSDLPLAGPVEVAVGSPAFPPLPGHTRVTRHQLRAGGGRAELFAVYGGIASGRMIVVGPPGSGKSATAIMLLLDAVDHRGRLGDQDRARVPVPVLLTASGWDPTSRSVHDWLVARLAAEYPLFQHRGGQAEAAAMVAAGAVALVLDGLDEMDAAWRAAALRALGDAPFRVVVLTRSAEMTQAASAAWLVGAVALQLHEVGGPQAADYLTQARAEPPPEGWTRLLTHLRSHSGSALTHALSTPLALTLVRDTYRPGDDVGELLDGTRLRTVEDIERHLIARVLPNAYTPRPGRPDPRYSLAQAHQTLAFLAHQMNQDRTRNLAWWRIPRWAPAWPRILATMSASGLLAGLLAGLQICLLFGLMPELLAMLVKAFYKDWPWMDLGHALLLAPTYGLGIGLPLGLAYGRGGRAPMKIKNWSAIKVRSVLATGLTIGLAAGLASVIISGPVFVLNTIPHVRFPLLSGMAGGLALGLLLGLKHDLPGGLGSPQGLATSWRKDRVPGLVAAVTIGLMIGLAAGFGFGLAAGLAVMVGFRLTPRLAGGFVAVLAVRSAHGESSPQRPLESWRHDRVFGLLTGLGLGLGLGLGFGSGGAILIGFKIGFGAGLAVVVANAISGALVGLIYGTVSSARWPTTLAWLQLRLSRRVPAVDLMAFLDDARDRDVLRTVGALYQFRHATLQDQLAGQATANPSTYSAATTPS